jgi:hypothetical protein
LAALLILPLDAHGQDEHARGKPSADDVGWLAGCWEMSVGDMSTEEHWMSPRGGMMLGLNRTIRSGRSPSYEFLILRESESGLVLEAHPSGQTSTEFAATQTTSESVTFENPQHDFPKRIRYARRGSDSLAARVDAGEGERGFEQLFRRVSCE